MIDGSLKINKYGRRSKCEFCNRMVSNVAHHRIYCAKNPRVHEKTNAITRVNTLIVCPHCEEVINLDMNFKTKAKLERLKPKVILDGD